LRAAAPHSDRRDGGLWLFAPARRSPALMPQFSAGRRRWLARPDTDVHRVRHEDVFDTCIAEQGDCRSLGLARSSGLIADSNDVAAIKSAARSLFGRRGPREVWLRRRTHGVEPSADVHLGVGFAAEVPCPIRICGRRVPPENGQLGIATSNHKPVCGIVGHDSADFTSVFVKRCHRSLMVTLSDRR